MYLKYLITALGIIAIISIVVYTTSKAVAGTGSPLYLWVAVITGVVAVLGSLNEVVNLIERYWPSKDGKTGDAIETVNAILVTPTSESTKQANSSLHTVPKLYRQFVGRDQEQDLLLGALRDRVGRGVIAIVGIGGIGKTALAREVCEYGWRDGLFDHIVWTSAKTEHFQNGQISITSVGTYDLDFLLDDIAHQCNRPHIAAMPRDLKEKAVIELLTRERALIVVDNLETVASSNDLVNALVGIMGQSKILITSRHWDGHDLAFTVKLHGLSEEDSITFLKFEGEAGNIPEVTTAPLNVLRRIYRVAGGAPLAMRLIVGQLALQSLEDTLKALERPSAKGKDYDFYKFVYWQSWQLLDDHARKALVDMSAFPPLVGGKRVDVEAVSQLDEVTLWKAMNHLVRMSLVDKGGKAGQERYALHPLTHYFVLADITNVWQ